MHTQDTRPVLGASALLILGLLLSGCGSSLRETYYIKAYSPTDRSTNFFRVRIVGATTSSRTKFSVGFFDRSAVERLFGENLLSREYMGSRIEVFDDKGSYTTELETQLTRVRGAAGKAWQDELRWIAATLSDRIGHLRVRLDLNPSTPPELKTRLEDAASAVTQAMTSLASTNASDADISAARNHLSQSLGVTRAIRLAVDGQVIVRFLDGAGNEVDVSNQVQLIFVATDAGRFTQALRDLVQSEKTRKDLISVVLGPRIVEAERIRAQLVASTAAVRARHGVLNARNTDIQAATTVAEIKALVLRTANETAGAASFRDAGSIRVYIEGL